MAGVFLDNEDFEIEYLSIVDGVNGPEVHITPLTAATSLAWVGRQNNPEWVARFTPIMNLINDKMLHDEKVGLRSQEVVDAVRKHHKTFPLENADRISMTPRVSDKIIEASFELGQVVNDTHPYTSPLLLMKMINNPGVTLAEYDAFVADEKLKDQLSKRKVKRKNSIGEVEMKDDAELELPYGSRQQIETETARRAMTLAQRTQAAQAAAGNPVGQLRPPGPQPASQPRWPDDISDAVTVRHSGQGAVRYFGPQPGDGSGGLGRGKPSDPDLLEIAKQTYKPGAEKKIGDAELVKETDTLKFYKKDNEIIIGVRGSRGLSDALSDVTLGARSKLFLQASPRLRGDIAEIKKFQEQYPPSQYHYSGVGHSLGGAIIDELIDQNLVSEGQSYNPAVHRLDLWKQSSKHRRIYNEEDPLYRVGTLAGQSMHNTEVRKNAMPTPLTIHENPLSSIQYQHALGNPVLEGGSAANDSGSDSDPMEYAYSDSDIRAALGNIPIHKYPELKAMASPDALFKRRKAVILLFLTEGRNEGHWIAVLDHDTHYEVFDSFGVSIDGNRKWLDKEQLMEFGQTLPLLSNLLGKGNKPVNHNSTKLQADESDTCGRWVVWRIKNAHKPLETFVAEMKEGPGTPDQKVVELTYGILDR
jgi:hypothetical protein